MIYVYYVKRDKMAKEEYVGRLKKLKSKTKRSSADKSKYVKYIFIAIVAIGLISIGYMAYNTINAKKLQEAQKFTDSKENGINGINQMFSAYPNDPNKALYLTQIKNAKSSDEINNILNDAKKYMEFKNYKVNSVNLIKNTYGKYYRESLYAQSLINKIENAQSSDEINNILNNANIEEDARKYYLNNILSTIETSEEGDNFEIKIGGTSKIMSKKELSEYISKLSLLQLKSFELTTPMSFNKITMIVGATQCGKMPLKGDLIYLYDKSNSNNTPIKGIVNSSYIIAKDISYSESKSTSSSITDGGGDSTSASSSSSINYNLNNINGILHATAVDKLDQNKIKDKFGNYGVKLNEISEDTQIFDDSVQYVLILSIPSDSVSKVISLSPENIYIVKAR